MTTEDPPDTNRSAGVHAYRPYWRVTFVTKSRGRTSRRRIVGSYQSSLADAITRILHDYPDAVFQSAKRFRNEASRDWEETFDLTEEGQVQYNRLNPLLVQWPPTPEPKPQPAMLDSKRLYITSLDEEADHRPGESDHVRLQRATLTMLRALYRQNEEITTAVTKHADIEVHLHGVDEDDDEEPQDFDAYRCAAFEATISQGQRVGSNRRCVLLDYHDGFPSKGHFYDPQTPCLCGKAIWSRACRQEEHPNGVAPEFDPRCAYRNENLARCVKSRHEDSKHTYIRWENSDA